MISLAKEPVHKTYLALTHGIIERNAGFIEKPLRQFGSGRMGVDMERGMASLTEFKVVERFPSSTLVKLYPVTGRRHQIRVHLYSLGHPVIGDLRYGQKAIQSRFPRLMLHAQKIECRLPSGKEIAIEAAFPESFTTVIDRIKKDFFKEIDKSNG